MNDMKTTTRPAVPADNGLMLPRLASAQATATPADKSTGGGCSHQFRGGCGQSVESHLGGAFKPSLLVSGCCRRLALPGAGARLRGLGEGFAWRAPRERFFAASCLAWQTATSGVCEHFVRFGRDSQPRPAAGACLS